MTAMPAFLTSTGTAGMGEVEQTVQRSVAAPYQKYIDYIDMLEAHPGRQYHTDSRYQS